MADDNTLPPNADPPPECARSDSTTSTGDIDTNDTESASEINRKITALVRRIFWLRLVRLVMLPSRREYLFHLMLCIICTVIANWPDATVIVPQSEPFFPINQNYVIDAYDGQMALISTDLVQHNDVVFVMFYAPWDANSQAARSHFLAAAEAMHGLVRFAAINCWQPGSECLEHNKRLPSWPVLYAQLGSGLSLAYNAPISAVHMVSFLRRLCRPLIRLYGGGPPPANLFNTFESVLVAQVSSDIRSKAYEQFYQASIAHLESHTFSTVHFAVQTNDDDIDLRNGSVIRLRLYHWHNNTVDVQMGTPPFAKWSARTVVRWLNENMSQRLSWLSPTGQKSYLLAEFVLGQKPLPSRRHVRYKNDEHLDRALFILFTPRLPLSTHQPYVGLLRQLCQEYYEGVGNVSNTILRQADFEHTNNVQCSNEINTVSDIWRKTHQRVVIKEESSNDMHADSQYDVLNFSSATKRTSHLCDKSHSYTDVMYTQLRDDFKREQCRYIHLAISYRDYHQLEMPVSVSTPPSNSNRTVYCSTMQRALLFIMMDSLEYGDFARQLGVNLSNYKDRTTAVIFNLQEEAHYVYEEPSLDENGLRQFLHRYDKWQLKRWIRGPIAHLPVKGSYARAPQHLLHGTTVQLFDFTDQSFNVSVLNRNNEDWLVLFYAKQCGLCTSIMHHLLHTGYRLSGLSYFNVGRIDVQEHPLSWQYTSDIYPTIVFFPAKPKCNSHTFPRHINITSGHLTAFVLRHLDGFRRVHAMWWLCLTAGRHHSSLEHQPPEQSCWQHVRAAHNKEWAAMRWHTTRVVMDDAQTCILHQRSFFQCISVVYWLLLYAPHNKPLLEVQFQRLTDLYNMSAMVV